MNEKTRFYHFAHSGFLLEIGNGYVRLIPLDGEKSLYSEKTSIIKMWKGLAHSRIEISCIKFKQLGEKFAPLEPEKV